ncbi:MAG: hypothetical protein HQL26_09770, partial [Candidatus Omnitrophica bacterium]|nr:hypothetical protein [Candidatus Omnitrophota bacterium]
MTVDPKNPLQFNFLIDRGQEKMQGEPFKAESLKLIKYFLASLTIPEKELWVNLSPYEKDRMINEKFGQTEMGRDLLAQDYMLKQLTSSLMFPEKSLGAEFWNRVYKKLSLDPRFRGNDKFLDIPINTFNKVWIVPSKAVVYEHGSTGSPKVTAFIMESHLKVLLEEDYIALQKNMGDQKFGMENLISKDTKVISGVTSQIVKEILIPEIEKEVNEGKTFANLRQIYYSNILATWFKRSLKESLLGQIYVNKNKTKGINDNDSKTNAKIYAQYLEAFKTGVFNYIKEDYDPAEQKVVAHKYFSGGTALETDEAMVVESTATTAQIAQLNPDVLAKVTVDLTSTTQLINLKTALHIIQIKLSEYDRNPELLTKLIYERKIQTPDQLFETILNLSNMTQNTKQMLFASYKTKKESITFAFSSGEIGNPIIFHGIISYFQRIVSSLIVKQDRAMLTGTLTAPSLSRIPKEIRLKIYDVLENWLKNTNEKFASLRGFNNKFGFITENLI